MFPIPDYQLIQRQIALSQAANPAANAPTVPQDTTPPYPTANQPTLINPDAAPKITAPIVAPATVPAPQNVNEMPFHKNNADLVPNIPNIPKPEDFHHKWWSNALNAVAGGLAGAAGHPEIGAQLRNAPYNEALKSWQTQVGAIKPNLDAETEFGKLSNTANIAGSKNIQGANIANAGNQIKVEGLNQKQDDFTVSEGRRQEDLDRKEAADKAKVAYSAEVLKMKKEQANQPKLSTPEKNVAGVRKLIAAHQESNPGESPEDARKAVERDLASASVYNPTTTGAKNQATFDVNNNADNVAVAAKNKADTEAAVTKARLEAQENSKQEHIKPVMDFVNQGNDDPGKGETKAERFSKLPPSIQSELYMSKDFKPPFKLSNQAEAQLATGRTTLGHLSNLSNMIQDPELQAHLGAIAGRIALAKQYVGGDPYSDKVQNKIDTSGLDPNSKEARFLTNISNLLNWEVKNVAGNRPAHQLFDRLAKNAPNSKQGIESFIGSLMGVRDGIVATMNGQLGNVNGATAPTPSGAEKKSKFHVLQVNPPSGSTQ